MDSKELRVLCRLAWNNWPDTPVSRQAIEASEDRDKYSAAAWDRVVATVAAALVPQERGSDTSGQHQGAQR